MSAFSLSVSEVGHLRAIVDLCNSTPSPEGQAGWAVLALLQELVGCDLVAFIGMDPASCSHYHRHVWASGDHFVSGSANAVAADGPDSPFWKAYPQCLPCSHPDRVGGRALVALDDFYSVRQWLATPMHLEVLRDVYDEMLMSFPDGVGRTVRLLFPRGRTSPHFGERERFALNLLAPHIERLFMKIRTPSPQTVALTQRQWQVLELVRLGLANKQIAHELGVSPGTVRKHLENAYSLLGVQSRAAAVHAVFDENDGLRSPWSPPVDAIPDRVMVAQPALQRITGVVRHLS
jgi:DNA-binding CsgD family transcriptional regulator